MSMEALFADWDWEDADWLAGTFEKFTSDLARCETLDLVDGPMPVTRQDFLDAGLTGIEFAAFKTRHPSGLGTDLVGLHSPAMTTEPGRSTGRTAPVTSPSWISLRSCHSRMAAWPGSTPSISLSTCRHMSPSDGSPRYDGSWFLAACSG